MSNHWGFIMDHIKFIIFGFIGMGILVVVMSVISHMLGIVRP